MPVRSSCTAVQKWRRTISCRAAVRQQSSSVMQLPTMLTPMSVGDW
jgi:hypothetical protein